MSNPPATVTEETGPDGVRRRQCSAGDWRIRTSHGRICNAGELDTLTERLGNAPLLPEMVFGHNVVEFSHTPTNTVLRFTAEGALLAWDHRDPRKELHVAHTSQWRKERREVLQEEDVHEAAKHYDWTFTTTYSGDVSTEEGDSGGGDGGSGGARVVQTVPVAVDDGEDVPIDVALLQRHDPIAFFDDVPLYEDELADNGSAMCSVKLRVMPTFWFALLRFFMRVDGVLCRVHDVRLFHKFGSGEVVRDVVDAQSSIEQLQLTLGPGDPSRIAEEQVVVPLLKRLHHACDRIQLG